MQPCRFTYVDTLRGISALAVIIVHFQFMQLQEPGPPWGPFPDSPLRAVLWPIYDYGGSAVQMFWILSGFVFTIAYAGEGATLDGPKFAAWRFSRLYPLHIVTLLIVAALQIASMATLGRSEIVPNNDASHFVLNVLFIPAWGFSNHVAFNSPIWSVSVELLVYALFFLFVKSGRAGLVGAASMAIGSAVAAHLTEGATSVAGNAIIWCSSYFFLGVCLAMIRPKAWMPPAGLALSLVLCVGIALSPLSRHTLLAATYTVFPAILLCAATLDLHKPPVPRSLRWIGDITYATYLCHLPMIIGACLVADWLGLGRGFALSPVTLLVYLVAVIAVGRLVHDRFEMPAQRWLRGVYRHARTSTFQKPGRQAPPKTVPVIAAAPIAADTST